MEDPQTEAWSADGQQARGDDVPGYATCFRVVRQRMTWLPHSFLKHVGGGTRSSFSKAECGGDGVGKAGMSCSRVCKRGVTEEDKGGEKQS